MENRHGPVVDGRVSEATGTAERDEAGGMAAARPGRHRITPGADGHVDTRGVVAGLRRLDVTPHVARNATHRRSAIDGRTTRHPGYELNFATEALPHQGALRGVSPAAPAPAP